MNILLDTHYLLWSFMDTAKIEKRILDVLMSESNEIFYSQASLWEISIKFALGKLSLEGITPEEFYLEIKKSHLKCRRFMNEELIGFHRLPIEHRDPFDRIMIWQAIKSDFYLLTKDGEAEKYRIHGLKIL
ncbi:MAG: type II toxin-antitoxin system VapC family toxin [Rectinemataceae bacterium]|nr:type II toxin-antitoxin system VapC family toxin [Rectinemataceae bacterium]